MWDNLLNFLVKTASVEPSYSKDHCIAFKQSQSVCSLCRDSCPHEAISFKRGKEVVIDNVDCTGCGLCVQVCPSQALEAKPNYQVGAPIKCSRVKGGAQTVHCLTRLSPSDLLRLASGKDKATLVRGDCATCPVGTEQVPETLDLVTQHANDLAALRRRKLSVEVLELDSYDATDNPDPISRRDLLRGGWRGLQQSAAEALAPFDPGGDNDNSLPKEMQRQYRLIERADPATGDTVPWILPRVAEGCIMCPVCTNVCPTKAFSRDFKPEGKEGTVLMLEPERCNGCNACTRACPVKVISLEPEVSWDELSRGKQEAFYKDPNKPSGGTIAR